MFTNLKQDNKVATYPGDITMNVFWHNPPIMVPSKNPDGTPVLDDDNLPVMEEKQMTVIVSGEILDQDGDLFDTITADSLPEVISEKLAKLGDILYCKLSDTRGGVKNECAPRGKRKSRAREATLLDQLEKLRSKRKQES